MPGGEGEIRYTARIFLIIFSLLLLFSDGAWAKDLSGLIKAAAADPAAAESLKMEIAKMRIEGAYTDITPLAMTIVDASKTYRNPGAAKRLLEVAQIAAPGEQRVHWAAAVISFKNMQLADAFRSAWLTIKAFVNDPWVSVSVPLKIAMLLCGAGFLTTLVILLVSIPYHLPRLMHDLGDLFPKSLRRLTPYGFLLLIAAALFATGTGPLIIFMVLPSLLFAFYLPKRMLAVLSVSLLLTLLSFNYMHISARLAQTPGERAFTLYRIYKGDSGPKVKALVEKNFRNNEYAASLSRSLLKRRDGDLLGAIDELKGAVNYKDDGTTYILLGNALFESGDRDAAIKLFKIAVEKRPDDWVAWYNLSLANTAVLSIDEGQRAMSVAEEVDGRALRAYESTLPNFGGEVRMASPEFPPSLIREQLMIPVNKPEWVEKIWTLLVSTNPFVRPEYIALFVALFMSISFFVKKSSLSIRCVSCGVVKCPRCDSKGKNPQSCSTCWQLSGEGSLDRTKRNAAIEAKRVWSSRKSAVAKLGALLFPGWSEYGYESGGLTALLLGLVWSLSITWFLLTLFVPLPLLPWKQAAYPVISLGIVIGCHLLSVMRRGH